MRSVRSATTASHAAAPRSNSASPTRVPTVTSATARSRSTASPGSGALTNTRGMGLLGVVRDRCGGAERRDRLLHRLEDVAAVPTTVTSRLAGWSRARTAAFADSSVTACVRAIWLE